MNPTLSIILPTIGRPSLAHAIRSICEQALIPGDEVLLVGDGFLPTIPGMVDPPLPIRYLSHGPTRNYGNAQRTFAQGLAHGSWITFMDDDDIYAEDAFVKIRKAIAQVVTKRRGKKFLVFKVVAPWGETVWTDQSIEQGNLCTLQMVVPNRRRLLPPWGPRQGANIPYFRALTRWAVPEWRSEIISIARPREEDLWWQR